METVRNEVFEKAYKTICLKARELRAVPWETGELKTLNGRMISAAAMDSIERHIAKADGVYSITRSRTADWQGSWDEMRIFFVNQEEIVIYAYGSPFKFWNDRLLD